MPMLRSRRTRAVASGTSEMMMTTPADEGVSTTLQGAASAYDWVRRLAEGNAVVMFSHSGCCMCHVVKTLLLGLGVGPAVYELDHLIQLCDPRAARDVQTVLSRLLQLQLGGSGGGNLQQEVPPPPVPAVFVGGRLLGGLEDVMACHISGTLVPLLKQAGALWL